MDRKFTRRSVVLIGLAIYFCLHACLRGLISPALNFDESEQSFLSQSLAWGYNSQPPLYTWIQKLIFEVLGCNAFAMAVRLNEAGVFTWVEWAATLASEIDSAQADGDRDLGDTYYRHWLNALETLVASKGLLGVSDMARRKEEWRRAYLATPHGAPIELSQERNTD